MSRNSSREIVQQASSIGRPHAGARRGHPLNLGDLGHANLSITEIYTQLSIEKLRQVRAARCPSSQMDKEKLLAELEAEEVEES